MSQISNLIEKWKIEPSVYCEVNFGNVPNFQAQQINSSTSGIDVKGAIKILSTYSIAHVFNNHGDHAKESLRRQIGVTEADFEKIPEILLKPDSIEKGNTSKKGDDAVLFKKKYGQRLYHLVMNVKRSKSSKKFVVGTLYIKLL